MKKVVLDTNIILNCSRRRDAFPKLLQHFGLEEKSTAFHISGVTEGEMQGLIEGNDWQEKRIRDFRMLVKCFKIVGVKGIEIAKAYAQVKLFAENRHKSIQPHGGQAFTMKQNDLWVGATALLLNAPLITTDKDFLPYHGKLINVLYVSPEIFKS